MSISRGIWKHLKTGKFFHVEGIARSLSNPRKQIVVFSQTVKNDTPESSLWFRDLKFFQKEFEKKENKEFIEELYATLYHPLNRQLEDYKLRELENKKS